MKKLLSLCAFAALVVIMLMGIFAAKEQGPPGLSYTPVELHPAPALLVIGAVGVAAVFTLGFGLMLAARLRRSISVNRLLAYLIKTPTFVSAALAWFFQSHVQTSRLRSFST